MRIDRLISTDAALDIVKDILAEHPIRGMRPLGGGAFSGYVEFKRAWAVSCSLHVSFTTGSRTAVRERRSNDAADHVWLQEPAVKITWSSTDRDVAAATACLALYRDVLDLAALLEARLAEETIGWSENAMKNDTTEVK